MNEKFTFFHLFETFEFWTSSAILFCTLPGGNNHRFENVNFARTINFHQQFSFQMDTLYKTRVK